MKAEYTISVPVSLVPCRRTIWINVEASSEAEAIEIVRKQLASDAYTNGDYAGETPIDTDEHFNLIEELDEPVYHYNPNDTNWFEISVEDVNELEVDDE